MIPRARLSRIFGLALPIIAGMVSQNLLNLVDTAMVGVLGDEALAATGMGSFVMFVVLSTVMGMGTGVQTVASRRVGEGRMGEAAVPLNGGLLLSVLLGVPIGIAFFAAAPHFFPLLVDDPQVADLGIDYTRIRIFSVVAMGWNVSFRGHWNATDRSRLYMGTIIATHVANAFLNWVFIYGNLGAPALGTSGAALASALATGVGTVVHVSLGFRHARSEGFLATMPSLAELAPVLQTGIPSSIQQLLFAAGLTAFMWIAGQLGTAELAMATVLINLSLVGILPAMGLGMASASLVGQALGRGNAADAKRWGWQVSFIAVLVVMVVVSPAIVIPAWVLSAFVHEPTTLVIGIAPLRLVGCLLAADAVGLVLLQSLFGAGDARRVAMVSIGMQWCLGLPLCYLLGPVLGFGLFGVWIGHGSYRVGQSVIMAFMWHRGAWANIRV
ncbi:MAG: MATE family efflux transporter [Myxococcales bacterium]|nr:MATE family efflux transporter [Myxococcales bacterium]